MLLSLEQRCILMGCHLGAFLDRSGQSAGSARVACCRDDGVSWLQQPNVQAVQS